MANPRLSYTFIYQNNRLQYFTVFGMNFIYSTTFFFIHRCFHNDFDNHDNLIICEVENSLYS